MIRFSIFAASALLLCGSVAGQQPLVQALRITTPVKDAGIYHLGTGAWTRATHEQANLGADVIFHANYPSGYYGTGWSGMQGVDEGVLPGTTSPKNGSQDEYLVDGWQFAYCCYDTALAVEFKWYDGYSACDDVSTPVSCLHQAGATFLVTGLPVGGCWIVTVDIAGTGYEVCFQADGGGGGCYPGYDGHLHRDSFGWGATYLQPGTAFTGPILAGYDECWATPGRETCYDPTTSECPGDNVGLGGQNMFAIDELNGCYWLGGYTCSPVPCTGTINPALQFWMVLYTDCSSDCGDFSCNASYCATNNVGTTRLHDCVVGTGLVLTSAGMTGGIVGYANVSDGQGVINDPPGAVGNLCLAGGTGLGRYTGDLVFGTEGTTDLIAYGPIPGFGGVYAPGQTWNFQTWYRVNGGSRFTDATTVTLE